MLVRVLHHRTENETHGRALGRQSDRVRPEADFAAAIRVAHLPRQVQQAGGIVPERDDGFLGIRRKIP